MQFAAMLIVWVVLYLLLVRIPKELDVPIYVALASVVVIVCLLLMSPLLRRLELRADKYAARLSGDPQALGNALTAAKIFVDETHRRVFGVGVWRWVLWPMSWRFPSHPSVEKRWAALAAVISTMHD
jgi:Zn-dependent protease with chaperone function